MALFRRSSRSQADRDWLYPPDQPYARTPSPRSGPISKIVSEAGETRAFVPRQFSTGL